MALSSAWQSIFSQHQAMAISAKNGGGGGVAAISAAAGAWRQRGRNKGGGGAIAAKIIEKAKNENQKNRELSVWPSADGIIAW